VRCCRPAPPLGRRWLGRESDLVLVVDLAFPALSLARSGVLFLIGSAGSASSWWWSQEVCARCLQHWCSPAASWWRPWLCQASSLQGCCRGTGGVCCHLVKCVADLGFCQAKAFTDTPVGGNGDGTPECHFSSWGTIAEFPTPQHKVFGMKTLPS
jgi:hypothetical protein